MRTTNKKYFKRFDIPDLKRLKIDLDESSIAWKFQHSTLIIGYDKPEKILELDRKKQQEIANLSKQTNTIPALAGKGAAAALPDPSSLINGQAGNAPECK